MRDKIRSTFAHDRLEEIVDNRAVRPNQRLKLTEPAVGECAARKKKETEMNSRHVRATVYMELTARCRSLAAVR